MDTHLIHEKENQPKEKKPNHLQHESSPYLLQHLYNPVDWYPYGSEAFSKAKQENKPIFLSLGYSACHWCHVMAHESFENHRIAEILNGSFVSIKVDKEERPDLDQVYQYAVQVMGKQGGWPLSVFLTPDGKPFFGGTYFPPTARYGMMGFPDLLLRILSIFNDNRDQVDQSGDQILQVLKDSFQSIPTEINSSNSDSLNSDNLKRAIDEILTQADSVNGGFGDSPKFPNFPALVFLMRQIHENTIRIPNDMHHIPLEQETIQQMMHIVELTLDKMAMGGIFDHIGGGFARYSVDGQWEIPHFEKMLYDNAMALIAYSEGYSLFQKPLYKTVVREIITWAQREMYDGTHGFYSTIDADSEGKEGQYYIWKKKELDAIIPANEQDLFYNAYEITEKGNFEEDYNHLNQKFSVDELSHQYKCAPTEIEKRLSIIRSLLFEIREKRTFPHRDEKLITAWNALFVHGLFQASRIFINEEFGKIIESLALHVNLFLRTEMLNSKSGMLTRIYYKGERKNLGTLDDYAYFIQSLFDEFEVTYNFDLIVTINSLRQYLESNFWNEEEKDFYYNDAHVQDIGIRPKLNIDNPLPSSPAVMIENYLQLYFYFNDLTAQSKANFLLHNTQPQATSHPLEHSSYWLATQWTLYGSVDIGIIAENSSLNSLDITKWNQILSTLYIPRIHLFIGPIPDSRLIAFASKQPPPSKILYSLCFHYNCFPVQYSEAEFIELFSHYFKIRNTR